MQRYKTSAVKERCVGIDCLRILFMFLIVLQHVTGLTGHNVPWFLNLVDFGVCGFIFISGWFSVSLKINKLVKLWLLALYAAILSTVALYLADGRINMDCFLYSLCGKWFLNAYTILLLLSPLINAGIEKSIKDRNFRIIILATAFILFCWIYPTTISPVAKFIPSSGGITMPSCLAMVCVYVLARYSRLFLEELNSWFRMVPRAWVAIIITLCFLINSSGLGSYVAPTSFLIVMTLVVWLFGFKSALVSKVVGLISPSLFAVYLYHLNPFCIGYVMKPMENYFIGLGLPLIVVHLIVSLIIFFAALLLDVPRRIVVKYCA